MLKYRSKIDNKNKGGRKRIYILGYAHRPDAKIQTNPSRGFRKLQWWPSKRQEREKPWKKVTTT